MTAERTTGVILRTRPLTETSLIVSWLTVDAGRISTAAKGARRPKSPLRGKLDLFFEADLSFIRSRRSELHTLGEVVLRGTHGDLRRELTWLHQASYAAALLEESTEADTPLPGYFQLLQGFLQHLPTRPAEPASVFGFEMKLLQVLGLAPNLDSAPLTEGARQILRWLAQTEWNQAVGPKLSAAQTGEIGIFLHRFLSFHLGRVPPSRSGAIA